MNRYHRQILLPRIGEVGQARLAASRVLLIGCGALGCVIAEQLVRAGVGFVRLVDRDLVELTNLQRQTLYTEAHAAAALPKAAAAAERLALVNSQVKVDPVIADAHAGNIEDLLGVGGEGAHLILDGTDNVATRYLINDVAVKHGVPWIYGGCVGTEGRVMTSLPGKTACLRCVFPNPPRAGDLPTCDTRGVLGPAAAIVGAMQATAALKLLTGNETAIAASLLTLDVWAERFHAISLDAAKDSACVCCGQRRFEYLQDHSIDSGVSLCGRDAVQVRGEARLELAQIVERWKPLGAVDRNAYLVRCQLDDPPGVRLTLFIDGRLIVHGTRDVARAKSLYARFVGS
jgi:adenylyltransferase/sulfurtransferase